MQETQNVFKYIMNARDTKCTQIYNKCNRPKM